MTSVVRERVEDFLGHWFEVHLVDGRIISGQLSCTDRDPNFVLSRAEERWELDEEPRKLGLALIARRHVQKILLTDAPYGPYKMAVPVVSPSLQSTDPTEESQSQMSIGESTETEPGCTSSTSEVGLAL